LVEDGRAMSPAANFLRSISKAYKEGTISPAERSRIKRHLIGSIPNGTPIEEWCESGKGGKYSLF